MLLYQEYPGLAGIPWFGSQNHSVSSCYKTVKTNKINTFFNKKILRMLMYLMLLIWSIQSSNCTSKTTRSIYVLVDKI